MRKFIVDARYGFGNRLIAMASGMRVAALYGRQFCLHWGPDDSGWQTHTYERFFEADFPVLADKALAEEAAVLHNAPERLFECNVADPGPDRDIWVSTYGVVAGEGEEVDHKFQPTNHLAPGMSHHLNQIRLKPEIMDLVDQHDTLEPGRTVGFHVRAGMGYHEAEKPEYFAFVAHSIVSALPSVKIFLATIDPLIEEGFRGALGDRLITYPKTNVTDDVEGSIDALVEMELLSRCSVIVKNQPTSFSYVSALRTLIPFVVLSPEGDGSTVIFPRPFEGTGDGPHTPILRAIVGDQPFLSLRLNV